MDPVVDVLRVVLVVAEQVFVEVQVVLADVVLGARLPGAERYYLFALVFGA